MSRAKQLEGLLKNVSRSFYLTLRVLPDRIRPQIGLAYLLARATDTIADTSLISVARRLDALRGLKEAILQAADGTSIPQLDFGELAEAQEAPAGQGSAAERTLLEWIGPVLEAMRGFSAPDRRCIRGALETITRGQEMDLLRFGSASASRIAALETDADLEDYIYCVAGCAGEFWTRMCRTHLFPDPAMDEAYLFSNGVRFGKGLQLVNILRDIPRDLRQGRCYIPRARLEEHGLSPETLLDMAAMRGFRRLYDEYLRQARDHLAAGWDYTCALPRSQVRVRLACAWPILIGMKTITRLEQSNVLDNHQRIQVSQSEVYRLLLRSVLSYPFPASWYHLFPKI